MIKILKLIKKDYNSKINIYQLEIKKGEIFIFLGGKAQTISLFKVIGQIDENYDGQIEIAEIDISQNSIDKYIGLVLNEIQFYNELSVKENIIFYASAYKLTAKQIQIKIDWISNYFNFRTIYNKKIAQCSAKELYLINLFIALLHSPNLLVLDNPYIYFLDDEILELNSFFNNLLSKRITIIYSTENLDHNFRYDRVCKLQTNATSLTFTKKEILEKNKKQAVL